MNVLGSRTKVGLTLKYFLNLSIYICFFISLFPYSGYFLWCLTTWEGCCFCLHLASKGHILRDALTHCLSVTMICNIISTEHRPSHRSFRRTYLFSSYHVESRSFFFTVGSIWFNSSFHIKISSSLIRPPLSIWGHCMEFRQGASFYYKQNYLWTTNYVFSNFIAVYIQTKLTYNVSLTDNISDIVCCHGRVSLAISTV